MGMLQFESNKQGSFADCCKCITLAVRLQVMSSCSADKASQAACSVTAEA